MQKSTQMLNIARKMEGKREGERRDNETEGEKERGVGDREREIKDKTLPEVLLIVADPAGEQRRGQSLRCSSVTHNIPTHTFLCSGN